MESHTKNRKLVHLWSVLCSASSVDADTKNLSLTNIIDQITVNVGKDDVERKERDRTNGYTVNLPLHFVSKLRRSVPGASFKFSFILEEIDPEGDALTKYGPTEMEVKKDFQNVGIRAILPRFLVNKTGLYKVRISTREEGENEFTAVAEALVDVSIAEARKVVV